MAVRSKKGIQPAGKARRGIPLAAAPVRIDRNTMLSATGFATFVGMGLFAFTNPVVAEPKGGVVVGGQATITQPNATTTTINQSSQRAVIDWQSFSINRGETVNFNQPGAASITLNRVVGPDMSVIAGTINANGQVILVNPAGVTFANGAQVNVNSLIATTANVSDAGKFMTGGKVAFDVPSTNPNASVINHGTITVREGGLVGLVGNHAANHGVINAKLGTVTIAGTETATVDLTGDGLMRFAVGKPGKVATSATNTGKIIADGGTVQITASAARGVVESVVNVQGMVQAQAVSNEGGVVVFGGPDTSQVTIGAKVDVSGGATQKGGTVQATGAKVVVQSTAKINASGGKGGGTINVGGNYQGKGPLANAKTVTVDKGATFNANATVQGNGGEVVIWSDDTTSFGGSITARGAGIGGDGGRVETSGKERLAVLQGASVDAGSEQGKAGSWLLDPRSVRIITGGPGTVTNQSGSGTYDIDPGTIQTALGSTNVIISTSGVTGDGGDLGNITVVNGLTWGSTNSLTLNADNNIVINAAISGANATLALNAGLTTAAGTITQTANIVANTLTVSTAGGNATLTESSNNIVSLGAVSLGAGKFELSDSGGFTVAGAVSAAGGVSLATTSILTLNNSITAGTSGVSLAATLHIHQNAGGIITADSVSVSALNASLPYSNVVSSLGDVTATYITFKTSRDLRILGTVSTIDESTITGKTISIENTINVGSARLTLVSSNSSSSSAISQNSSGVITAGTLRLTSANGGAQLSSATNLVGSLGSVALGAGALSLKVSAAGGLTSASVSANGGISIFNTAGDITTTGALTASSGVVLLSAAASGKVITLGAGVYGAGVTLTSDGEQWIGYDVNGGAGTVRLETLGTAKNITQTGGTVTAGTLELATSGGNVDLYGNNQITNLGAVSLGAGALLLKSTPSLTVTGAVAAGGGITLEIGGAITVNKSLTVDGTTGVVALLGSGGVSQNASGVISGRRLEVLTANQAANLATATNAVSEISANVGNAEFKLLNSKNLTVSSATYVIGGGVTGTGTGGVTITTAGTLTIGKGVVSSNGVTLTTTGSGNGITQTAEISAATLSVNTDGGNVTLTGTDNQIDNLGASNLGTGKLQFAEGAFGLGFTVSGAVSASGGISLSATNGAIDVNAALNAGSGDVALQTVTGGGIFQNSNGVITAKTLTVTGAGGVFLLDAANQITNLGASSSGAGLRVGSSVATFTTTGTTSGDIVELSAAGGNLVIDGAVNGTATVILTAAGTITQSAAISAGTLRLTTTNGNVTLTNASNAITNLGNSNLGSGNLQLVDTGGLAITNPVTATGGIALNTSGALTTSGGGSLDAGSGNIALTTTGSGNAINVSGLTAATLSLTTTDAGASADGAIVNLGAVSLGTGALSIADAGGLTITGAVGAGSVTLQTSGPIVQTGAGAITTSTLNLTTSNSYAMLDGATNVVGSLGTVSLGTGAFWLKTDAAGGFTVPGASITAHGGISVINTTGDITTSGAISVTSGAVLLSAATSGKGVTLAGAVSGVGVTLVSGSALTINHAINAGSGTLALTASSIEQTTGTLTADTLTLTTGDALLAVNGLENAISNLGASSMAGHLALYATSSKLTVTGPVTAAGSLILRNIGGALAINAPISGVDVGLYALGGSANTITQTASGAITATTLVVVTSDADAILDSATNAITKLNTASVGAGNFRLLDAGGLTVTNMVGATAGIAITTSGALALNGPLNSAGTVSLTTTGSGNAITQGSTSVGAGILQLATDGGDVTLNHTTNFIYELGAVSLGTGKLQLSTKIADFIAFNVSGAVNASGGISLTTPGALTIRNTLDAGTGTLSLNTTASGGNITQALAGSISAGTLEVSTNGGNFSISDAKISNVGTVSTGAGYFQLFDTGGLTVTGTVSAASVALITSGALAINNTLTASSGPVTLTTSGAGNAITQNSSGVITANQLSVTTSDSNVALNTATNVVPTAGAETGTGAFALKTDSASGFTLNGTSFAANGGVDVSNISGAISTIAELMVGSGAVSLNAATSISVGGTIAADGISLTSGSALAIGSQLNAGTGTATLTVTGAGNGITQGNGGKITAGTLKISTNDGAATFDNADNAIDNLGASSLGTGALTLVDNVSLLRTSGDVAASGGISITNSGAIYIDQKLTAGAGTLSLNTTGGSTSVINAGKFPFLGVLDTDSLSVSTVDADVFLPATFSRVAALGIVNVGAGSFYLSANGSTTADLTIVGANIVANGGIEIGHHGRNLTTVGAVSASGGQVLLGASGTGELILGGAVSGQGVTLVSSKSMTLNHAVNSGSDSTFIQVNAGGISQTAAGVVTAGSLRIDVYGGSDALLDGATNVIGNIGYLRVDDGGSFKLLNNTATLTVGGPGASLFGSADIAIQNSGAIVVNSLLQAAGTVSLATTGGGTSTITQNADGVIKAATLSLATSGANVSLATATSEVTNLGATNVGAGSLTLLDAGGLTVSDGVTALGGIALNTSGALALGGALTSSGTVALTTTGSGNAITQSAAISASTLQVTTTDANATLTATNAVTNLGASSLGTGALSLVNDRGLSVNSAVTATGGVTLSVNGTLFIGKALNAGGGNVTLQAGAVSQATTGIVTANTLFVDVGAGSGVGLATATNAVTNLGTSTKTQVFRLKTSVPTFTVVDPTTMNALLALENTGGGIVIAAATGTSSTLSLTAAGAITQSAAITTPILELTISGNNNVTLTHASNAIGSLAATSLGSGTLALVDTGGLTIGGAVNAGGATITTSGALAIEAPINVGAGTLALITSGGSGSLISQSGSGVLTAGTLTLSTDGASASLDALANVVTNLGASSTFMTSLKTDVPTFTVTGAQTVGTIALTNTGKIVLEAPVDAGASGVSLTTTGGSASTISQTGAGVITSGNLFTTTTNADVLLETATNAVTVTDTVFIGTGTYALKTGAVGGLIINAFGISTNGGVSFTNTTGGISTVGAVVSDGAILLSAAASGKSVDIGGAVTGVGVSIVSDGSLVIDNHVKAGSGDLVLTSLSGSLTATNTPDILTTATATLTAKTGINTSDAHLYANTLNVTTANANVNLFNGYNNVVNLGTVSLGSGNFDLLDAQGITVTGTVSASGGIRIDTGGLLTVGNTLNAGASYVTLYTADPGNQIVQTSAGVITAGTLNVRTINADAKLNYAENLVGALGTVAIGTGAFSLRTNAASGFTVNPGGITANGGVSVSNASGNLTTTGAITATGGAVALVAGGSLTLGGDVTGVGVTLQSGNALTIDKSIVAGSGTLSLSSFTSISQTAGTISGSTLTVTAFGGSASLTQSGNAVDKLSAVFTSSGGFSLTNSVGLAVTFSLVTSGGDVTLSVAGPLSIQKAINAGANTVSLTTTGSGNAITQTSAGVITAGTLTLTTTNADATLNTATNAVSSLGAVALGTGSLNLLDAGGLTVSGSVGAANVTLNTGGVLAINNHITADTLSLTTTGGSGSTISQASNKFMTVGTLQVSTQNASVSLYEGNSVDTLAASNVGTGELSLLDTGGLTVGGAVTATGGITLVQFGGGALVISAPLDAGSAQLLLSGSTITQSAAGKLTAGSLAGGASNSVDLTTADNAIAGIFAASATNSFALKTNVADFAVDTLTAPVLTLTNVGGGIVVNGALTGTTSVSLTAGSGGISQNGSGVITAGALSLSTQNADVDLTVAANAVSALGTVNVGAGAFALKTAAASGFTVNPGGITANGGVAVTNTTGNLATSGAITATNGAVVLRATAPGSTLALGGAVTGAGVTLEAGGALAIERTVNAGFGTLSLKGASISQTAAIAGGTLEVTTTTGDAMLTNAGNDFTNIGASSALNLLVYRDANALNVTGSLTSNTSHIDLRTAGAITIAADVTAAGSFYLDTTAGIGAITQTTAGKIVASVLGAKTIDNNASFENATNEVGAIGTVSLGLGAFSLFDNVSSLSVNSGNITAGGVHIANVGNLATTGAIAATSVKLAATGALTLGGSVSGANVLLSAGAGLALDQSIDAVGGTVTLVASNGAITQSAGSITAANLVVSTANGDATLAQANAIDKLGASTLGAGSFSLTDAGSLTVNGAVNASGGIAITTSGALVIDAALNAGTSNSVSLTTTGGLGSTITQSSAGVITAGFLSLSTSDANATLSTALNKVGSLDTVTLGTGALAFKDVAGLGIFGGGGGVSASGGITISTSGLLDIQAQLNAGTTGNVSLSTTGGSTSTIVESIAAGIIKANTLAVSTEDALVQLLRGNVITNLGASSVGTGQLKVANTTGLTVTGAVAASGGITLNAAGGALAVNSTLNAGAGSVSLSGGSSGISQNSSGVIAAGALIVSTTGNGSANLASATNFVDTLQSVSVGNGAFALKTNSTALDVGIITALGGVSVTNVAGGIAFTSTLNAGSGALTLNADGAIINDPSLAFAAGTLSVATTNDNVTLTGNLTTFGSLGTSNLGNAQLIVNDTSGGLAVTGAVTARGGVVIGTVDGLAIQAAINAGSGTVGLSTTGAAGHITQNSSGVITAGTLIVNTSLGANVALATATNVVTNLGTAFSSSSVGGGLQLKSDVTTLTVAGTHFASGAVQLENTGKIVVNNAISAAAFGIQLTTTGGSTSTITQGVSGTLSANALAVTTTNANVNLATASANFVTALGTVSTGTGSFALRTRANSGLAVAGGSITANGGINIVNATGAMTSSGPLSSAGTVTLGAAGTLTLNGPTGGSAVTLSSDGAMAIDGQIDTAGTLSLTVTGFGSGITQSQAINAGTLTVFTNNGTANLDLSNAVGSLGTVSVGTGSFTLRDTGGLNVTGTVSSSSGVSIETSGALAIGNTISGNLVSLTTTGSGNGITQTSAGAVTANSFLLTTSNGDALLDTATNAVAGFSSVSLGTGRLALKADAAGGFTANGGNIAANGGIAIENSTGNLATVGTLSTGGAVSLVANASGKSVSLGGPVTGAGVSIKSNDALTLGQSVDAGSGTLALEVTGAGNGIGQSAGTLTAGTLTVATDGGSATLTQANAIANLGASSLGGGAFSLSDAGGLTVTGALAASGGITLSTSGALQVNQALNAGTGSVSLAATAAGHIAQSSTGLITAGTFTATASAGHVSLGEANQIAALGASSAGSGFILATAAAGGLAITGDVSGSSLDIRNTAGGIDSQAKLSSSTQLTLNAAGNLTTGSSATKANGSMSFTASGNVSIGSGGAAANGMIGFNLTGAGKTLTQSGAISANLLSVDTNNGNVTLTNAGNAVNSLNGAALGTGKLQLTDVGGLTVSGAVTATGGVSLSTSGTLSIDKTIDAGTGTVALTSTTSGKAIGQNASGAITAGTLELATVDGDATLNVAPNAITNLGAVSLGTGALTLADAGGLTVTGAVAAANATIETWGALAIQNTVNVGTGTLSLTTTGGGSTISQGSAGVITAGSLTVSNTGDGSVLLDAATNQIGVLAGVTATGSSSKFALLNAGGLTVSGPVEAWGPVAITTSGALSIGADINANYGSSTISLVTTGSGNAITQTGGVLYASALTVSTENADATLGKANAVIVLGSVSLGSGALAFTSGDAIAVTGNVTATGGITLTALNGYLSLGANALDAGTGTVSLTATGANSYLTQAQEGVVTAGTLLITSTNLTWLAGANAVTKLGTSSFGTGESLFRNGAGLTVAGPVSGASIALSADGTLAIENTINAGANGSVTLGASSAGTGITQTAAGAITAGKLYVYTDGTDAALTGTTNAVGELLAATMGKGTLSLLDAGGLTVGGQLNAGAVNLTTSGAIAINGPVNVGTGTVSLTATGGNDITQKSSGIVTAGTLILSGASADLTAAKNKVINLGAVTLTAGSLQLSNNRDLTVAGAVNVTGGDIALSATGSLAINNTLNAGTGDVFLNATGTGGTIGQASAATITAGTLSLTTIDGNATLNAAANEVTSLGTVSLGTGALNLLDAGGLIVGGAVAATGGITLNTSGALSVQNTLNAGANTASLSTTGSGNAISQTSAGKITAGTLSLSTDGGDATLNTTANAVAALGPVSLGAGALDLLDAGGLTVSGAVASAGIVLNTSGALAINGTLNAGNGQVSLTTTGTGNAITQGSSAAITAGTLVATTDNADASLNGSTNAVTKLGATSLGTGALSLLDAGGLTVSGAVTATGGIALQTSGALALQAALNGDSGTVSLTTTGGGNGITQTVGKIITAGTLHVATENGDASLVAANMVDNLGTSALGTGKLMLVSNAATLTTTGNVGATGGIHLGASGGDLQITAALDAGTGNVVLESVGAIGQGAAGVIAAGELQVTAGAGNAILDVATSQIAKLGNTSVTGDFRVADAGGLSVTGTVAASNISIGTTGALAIESAIDSGAGTVSVNASGGVTQTSAGLITAGIFKAATNNANVSLTAGNAIDQLGATDLGSGALTLVSAGALSVSGAVKASGGITLSAASSLYFDAALNAGAGAVRLSAEGIGQKVSGVITAGSLLVRSAGAVDLTSANEVGTVAGVVLDRFRFNNNQSLAVTATGDSGDAIVAGAVGITVSGGASKGLPALVDLTVSSGDLTISGSVATSGKDGGMVLFRRIGGTGSITVDATPTADLLAIDLTAAPESAFYKIGKLSSSLLSTQTPATGTSPIAQGGLTEGAITLGEVALGDSTTYLFGNKATFAGTSDKSQYGVLGVYGTGNKGGLEGEVRKIDPTTTHDPRGAYTEAFATAAAAAFYVRRDDGASLLTLNGVAITPAPISPVVDLGFFSALTTLSNPMAAMGDPASTGGVGAGMSNSAKEDKESTDVGSLPQGDVSWLPAYNGTVANP